MFVRGTATKLNLPRDIYVSLVARITLFSFVSMIDSTFARIQRLNIVLRSPISTMTALDVTVYPHTVGAVHEIADTNQRHILPQISRG